MTKKTPKKPAKAAKKVAARPRPTKSPAGKPKLLSGGNPQIAKAYGDAPVAAYIAAMPGWKQDIGRRLDALIVKAVPGVRKAVKWNSPFYGSPRRGQETRAERAEIRAGRGSERQEWILNFHCFTNFVRVAFFRGRSLRPIPPGTSKQKDVRYFDIREDDKFDEAQFVAWVKQASRLPGQQM